MPENATQWFIAERSRALALMHLSHRKDLVIKEVKDQEIGLSFLLSIVKENVPPSVRQFGITLGGSASPVTAEQLNKILRPTTESFLRRRQFPYPVGLLHFTMQDDQGYF